MDLLRFREIRERLKEISNTLEALNNDTIELSLDEENELDDEFETISNEIHDSDLSNIPFEEFSGFYDLGFDFNGTGANIDFNLIDESRRNIYMSPIRFQRCNFRNLDLSRFDIFLLDDNSFDKDIMEKYPEYFAPKKITDTKVRDRYYKRNGLNLSDIKKYDMKDVELSRINVYVLEIINKIGLKKTLELDDEIVSLLDYKFANSINSSDLTSESSAEEIDSILRDIVVYELTNSSNAYEREFQERLFQSGYVRRNFPEYVVDFSEGQEKLKEKFCRGQLTLDDLFDNYELFKNKKFISRLFDPYIEIKKYSNLTEKQIIYLIEKLPNIAELLKSDIRNYIYAANIIDVRKEPEENRKAILELFQRYKEEHPGENNSRSQASNLVIKEILSYEELINDPKLGIDEIYKPDMLKVVSSPLLEKLESFEGIDIKGLIQSRNYKFFSFFARFGIDAVLEFEEKNGPFFIKDGVDRIDFVEKAYMHYGNPVLFNVKSEGEYTKEQFEEFVRRIIVHGPTDSRSGEKLDYRDLRGPFRDKHRDLFLPEDAPQELQDKFYKSVITIEDILTHADYMQYLKDVDLDIALERLPFYVEKQDKKAWSFLKEKVGSINEIFSFLTKNASIINYLKKDNGNYSKPNVMLSMSLDDALFVFNIEIENRILNYNLSYGEDAPEFFKQKHGDYFLAEDAPDALKDLFYPDRTKIYNSVVFFEKSKIEELSKQEGWQQYLVGKGKNVTLEILKKFVLMANTQAVKEIFLYYLENEQDMAIELICYMTAEQILQIGVILPEEKIKKLVKEQPDNALLVLLFSENVDKEKLLLLIKYKELNNQVNTIDTVLSNIYSENISDIDELNRKINEIYDLFTYDNIPEFLKTFRLFELGKFASVENDRIQSYKGVEQNVKRNIIMADLFRISLDSNNKSLNDFARIMKYGDEILAKISQNGEIDLLGLSEEEYAVFSQYVDTLVTMHNISANNADNKKTIEFSHALKTDFEKLKKEYDSDKIPFSSSKVLTGMFNGEVVSEVTPDSIIQYMKIKKEQRAKVAEENSEALKSKSLKLESGDFIKGIRDFPSYLKSMLRYGLKCGEFNRENSHSDCTKLDLDFGYISDANFQLSQKTDYDVITTTISYGYGDTYIVFKDYGKKFNLEGQIQDDMPIKFLRGPEYWTNKDDSSDDTDKDRYIRTGVGVLDIDYIVSREWQPSLGYEMAMAGVFIPVKNEKDELVFSYEDYEAIRTQMKGLSYFEMGNFEVDDKAKELGGLYEIYISLGGDKSKIEECNGIITGKEDKVTSDKKKSTLDYLKIFFEARGIYVADNLSSNLSEDEIELIDTGSTGRGTNVPGDGDFDFTLRHNLAPTILGDLQSYIFSLEMDSYTIMSDGFRTYGLILPDEQKVDLDIVYAKKNLSLEYSSDMSVKDRLKSIKDASQEDYNYVRANIIIAKNILKKMGIYKKKGSDGATKYGGFGGIGIENWILQNGGSFAQAIDTYLAATKDENEKNLSYKKFIEKYPIFDFGNNHREGRLLHDRFSAFLADEDSFEFVKKSFSEIQRVLREYREAKKAEVVDVDIQEMREEPTAALDELGEDGNALRNSISVEGLREASKSRFRDFYKSNFLLMAKLLEKYHNKAKQGLAEEITDDKSKIL